MEFDDFTESDMVINEIFMTRVEDNMPAKITLGIIAKGC